MNCGLSVASSVIVTVPVRTPFALGLKATLIVQLPPAGTLEPQLFCAMKSPLAAMLEMVNVAPPVLVSVTLCGLLVVPTSCLLNARAVWDRLTAGAIPFASGKTQTSFSKLQQTGAL